MRILLIAEKFYPDLDSVASSVKHIYQTLTLFRKNLITRQN